MRRPFHSVPATALLLLLVPAALSAQRADSVPIFRPGAVLRAELSGGERVQGLLVSQDQVALTLRQDHAQRRVASAELGRVWVRERSTRTGAIVGGIAGAVSGGVLFNIVARVACESSDCQIAGATLVGVGVGALGGGLVGAVIGAAIPHWRLRFP